MQTPPTAEDVDAHGVTHVGRVREENQDHFLIAQLRRRMRVIQTSMPDPAQLPLTSQRMTYLLAVADGAGGTAAGRIASGTALQGLVEYLTHHVECYYGGDPQDDEAAFEQTLVDAVMACHHAVIDRETRHPEWAGMATTLTIVTVVWPRAYVVQVGDSRCYQLHAGALRRVTKDQTLAQELVDGGALTESQAERSQWNHVLSSSVGGRTTAPVVTHIPLTGDDVLLLCSDGLTKHVSDEELAMLLQPARSAEATCNALVETALARGGTDNVTAVVFRVRA